MKSNYRAEWDDNGWWIIWKDIGDKWKVFICIEDEEDDQKANTIVKALNGYDIENSYINMLIERDEKIKQLEENRSVVIQQNDGDLIEVLEKALIIIRDAKRLEASRWEKDFIKINEFIDNHADVKMIVSAINKAKGL